MSEVAQVSQEKQFVSTFLQLINLSADAPSNTFLSTDDYNKLESLGPSLPKIKASLPKGGEDDQASNKAVTLNFKSIKPPYKFSTQLSDVPLTHSIYKVKTDLIDSVSNLKDTNVSTTDLKLMIKGKVIQDSTILSSVPSVTDGLTFMVMVSTPISNSQPEASTPVKEPSKDLDDSVSVPNPDEGKLEISPSTWNKLHQVLLNDLPSKVLADKAFHKLQNNWAS